MAETFVTLYQGNGGRVDIGYTLSQSIENNQTTITATAYAVKTNSSYYSYRSSPQNFTLTINGNAKVYGWTFNFGNMNLNQRYVITSHAVTINNNPDGSLGSISTSVYCATGTDGLGTINGSTAIAIPTIPRASSISSISGGTLGSPVTVNISRASASFTHTVVYRRTDGVDVNVGSDQGTSCVFTPSIDDSALLPNVSSGIATIFVHTYIGGSYVGTASQSFTVYVPSSVIPVINSVSKSEAVAGIATKFGGYVQNKSKLAISIGAVGAQGSTVTSWTTTILGIAYSGASFTSGLLTSVGTVTVETTVWDSRGRSRTTSSNIIVMAYSPPSILAFSGFRSLSSGVQDIINGTYLRSAMNFTVAPVNVGGVDKNSKSYTVEYKLQSSGTWLPVQSGSFYAYNSAFTTASGILSTNSAYDIRLTVADYFSSVTATFQVGTAFALMDWHGSGTSMAIGKVAEGLETLEIGGSFGVTGAIVPKGTINHKGRRLCVLSWYTTSTWGAIKIKTKIPFMSGAYMPEILISGYAYGLSSPIDIKLVLYIYNGSFVNFGATANGAYRPNIYISNEGGFICVTLSGVDVYYPHLYVDVSDARNLPDSYFSGWSVVWESPVGGSLVPYYEAFSGIGHTHTPSGIGAEPAIVSGSNANGYYRKFADGTMICWGEIPQTAISNLSEPIITFPVSFYNTATTSFVATGRPSASWTGFGIVGQNIASVSSGRITVATGSPQYLNEGKWTAIGRWK